MSGSFLTFLMVSICNGQTIVDPTSSDSTGDYYVATNENNFGESEIHCTSNVACYIECKEENSCIQLIVNCGNSPICDIKCRNDDACKDLTVFISHNDTTISCIYFACSGDMTLYNNYTNYPSSTTLIHCDEYASCYDIAIKDAVSGEDNYNELTAERFKIYCRSCAFEAYGYFTPQNVNPIVKPSIINETGEYYLDTGSLVDIECTTDKLCYINCNHGSCTRSNIDCGPSQECFILSSGEYGSEHLYVTAAGQDQFTFFCDINTGDCADFGDSNLRNISKVNITCNDNCAGIDWRITSVQDLNVFCDFYWTCSYSGWWLTDVDNAVIACNASCRSTEWELNNVGYQKFDCIGEYHRSNDNQACNDLVINGQETSQLDMFCENEYSCQDITICTDNTLNLDCQGSSSCNPLNICNATLQSNKTNIIQPPTAHPTQYPTTAQPTTTEPTTNPTTAEPTQDPTTAKPTQDPTTAEPTAPTGSPTTAQPTEPTTEPSKEPTDLNIPNHSNGEHRSFALFWMVMVITIIAFVQIM